MTRKVIAPPAASDAPKPKGDSVVSKKGPVPDFESTSQTANSSSGESQVSSGSRNSPKRRKRSRGSSKKSSRATLQPTPSTNQLDGGTDSGGVLLRETSDSTVPESQTKPNLETGRDRSQQTQPEFGTEQPRPQAPVASTPAPWQTVPNKKSNGFFRPVMHVIRSMTGHPDEKTKRTIERKDVDWEGIVESYEAQIAKLRNEVTKKENEILSARRYTRDKEQEWAYNSKEVHKQWVAKWNGLVHLYNPLVARAKNLEAEIIQDRETIKQQSELIRKNEKELRKVQEAEFFKAQRTQPTMGPNHERVQEELDDLFSSVTKWSRLYFKCASTTCLEFDALSSLAPEFAELLSSCCRNPSELLNGKNTPKLSTLIEATVNDFLVYHIFMHPFGICSPETTRVCTKLYENLKKTDATKANKWRAVTLEAIENSMTQNDIAYYTNPDHLVNDLFDALKPIFREIGLAQPVSGNEIFDSCQAFMTGAIRIAKAINSSAAGLEAIDRLYFEKHGWQYCHNNEAYVSRFQDEEEETEYLVDLIIRPGLMKYGDDKGNNSDVASSWISAVVKTMVLEDKATEAKSPESSAFYDIYDYAKGNFPPMVDMSIQHPSVEARSSVCGLDSPWFDTVVTTQKGQQGSAPVAPWYRADFAIAKAKESTYFDGDATGPVAPVRSDRDCLEGGNFSGSAEAGPDSSHAYFSNLDGSRPARGTTEVVVIPGLDELMSAVENL
ncbi:hypothetical protein BJ508DRAFT_311298 [Ascobolus immersus RN42]|uniref:Uncharacterized protein n=1 Tax=Ascobolus immersus RN42 TaxID=1160509 RepID=A0A3N4HW28_ASCIM|nr:hypothetical protein BJ508DRAFT_311298 [Ascobolus immersus RN42]